MMACLYFCEKALMVSMYKQAHWKRKTKRMSIPKDRPVASVDLEIALGLLSLPREVGTHPETNDMIEASIGRFGPYLKYQGKFASLPKDEDVLAIGINRAVDILAEAAKRLAGHWEHIQTAAMWK